MTSFRLAFAGILFTGLTALAGDNPTPAFRLPVSPVVPSPMPSAVTTLAEGQVFVIQREADFRVYEGVKGAVSVKVRKLTKGQSHSIDGVFVDGTGQREEREYVGTEAGVYLAVIRPLKDGPVDVILAPRVATEEWEIRLPLTVRMGNGPQPPPKPVDPKVEPVQPAKSLRVFLVFESEDSLTPAQRGVIYGKVVEDWLNANCTGGKAGWRRRDKDSPGEADPTMAALWSAVQPKVTATPCVAVERDGKVELIDLGANPAKMVEVLNSYKGGK